MKSTYIYMVLFLTLFASIIVVLRNYIFPSK